VQQCIIIFNRRRTIYGESRHSSKKLLHKSDTRHVKKNVLSSDLLSAVQNVKQNFSFLKLNHGKPVLTKLKTVFEKNNGLGLLEKISKMKMEVS